MSKETPVMNSLEKIDAVFSALPEILRGQNLWQNDFHEFDVFTHTTECVRHLKEFSHNPNLIAAAWLHDVGKPAIATPKLNQDGHQVEKDGKAYHTFKNHERVGQEIVEGMPPELFASLGLDQQKIATLVGGHFLPMRHIKKMRQAAKFEEFSDNFHRLNDELGNQPPVSKKELLDIFLADSLAKGQAKDQPELLAVRETLLKTEVTETDLHHLYDIQKATYGGKE